MAANLDIDGVELGSTHYFQDDLSEVIRSQWDKQLLTHNFFPPSKDPDFVINLAAQDRDTLDASVAHAIHCLEFSAEVGSTIYTVHPGFMSKPLQSSSAGSNDWDFSFSESKISHANAFNVMLKSLEKLLERAQSLGVKLAVESEGSITKQGVLLLERPDEYDQMLSALGSDIGINCNLAHTRLAGKLHGFDLSEFIDAYSANIVAAEVSHNDGVVDEHLPLIENSYVFDFLYKLPDVPIILEFRDASLLEVETSIELVRENLRGTK